MSAQGASIPLAARAFSLINSLPSAFRLQFILKKLPTIIRDDKIQKYSYRLQKIQIPLFSKKQKQNPSNMKIISEMYCKNTDLSYQQKNTISVKCSKKMEQIYILSKAKKSTVYLSFSQEDVRKMHLDYNNYNYWKTKDANEQKGKPTDGEAAVAQVKTLQQRKFSDLWNSVQLDPKFQSNYIPWLEENVWDYYD